jgi:hypothetical protein
MTVGDIDDCAARRKLLALIRSMPANAISTDYLERARRIRALADEAGFPHIRAELLEVAVEFEGLAHAERGGTKEVRFNLITTRH